MNQARRSDAQSVLARSVVWTRANPDKLLSPAETWNLTLLSTCDLESYDELAAIRGVSARTIANQMRSARMKLSAKTNLFAVTEALRQQLIPEFDGFDIRRLSADILVFRMKDSGA